jgi:Domain of unknown function (DUF4397)
MIRGVPTKRFFIGALAVVSAIIGGCGGSDDDNNEGSLRVGHFSPDAPAVDVLVDGGRVAQDVTFGENSGYLAIESGRRTLSVNAANSPNSVISAPIDIQPDESVTVLAINRLAQITPLVLRDERTPASNNGVKVRVVHGAVNAPNVDVYATAPNASLEDATPVLTNVAFGTASNYLVVPPGAYRFRVTPTGTKTVAIDSGTLNFNGGEVSTVIARDTNDTQGGAPLTLSVLDDRQ